MNIVYIEQKKLGSVTKMRNTALSMVGKGHVMKRALYFIFARSTIPLKFLKRHQPIKSKLQGIYIISCYNICVYIAVCKNIITNISLAG